VSTPDTTDERAPFAFSSTAEQESPEQHRRRVVFEAIGAASTCWESLRGSGVFDEALATEIGETLLAELSRDVYPRVEGGLVVLGPECVTGTGDGLPSSVITYKGETYARLEQPHAPSEEVSA
jgi:hypothetical protein